MPPSKDPGESGVSVPEDRLIVTEVSWTRSRPVRRHANMPQAGRLRDGNKLISSLLTVPETAKSKVMGPTDSVSGESLSQVADGHLLTASSRGRGHKLALRGSLF